MKDTVKSTVESILSILNRLKTKALPMSETAGVVDLSSKFGTPLKGMVGRNFLSIDELR
jgi:hypothetical protein